MDHGKLSFVQPTRQPQVCVRPPIPAEAPVVLVEQKTLDFKEDADENTQINAPSNIITHINRRS